MCVKNDKMWKPFVIYIIMMLNALFGDSHLQNFNHENIRGSSWRTIGYDEPNDPKNTFFLRMDLNEDHPPVPESSTKDSRKKEFTDGRDKRQADEEIVESGTVKIKADIEEELSTQQQEVDTLDTLQISTETSLPTTEMEENFSKNNFIPINDFIRFRRQLVQKGSGHVEDNGSDSKDKNQNIDIENENTDVQNSRGPRGLGSQEWDKFPRQNQRNQRSDDSFATTSDFNKPRRVHFITQKQFAVEDPLETSRQGRVADPPRHLRDQPREPRMEIGSRKGKEIFTPKFRDFDSPPDYSYSRGRYYERDLIENRRPDLRSLEIYPRYRDRRIIYYANLPEITRNSPRFREMGRYRDPYDDRYLGNFRQRGFYRDDRDEELYPMKVSADINVREVKKNPEKRIYSDVKRKYSYDMPSFDSDQQIRH